VTVVAEKSRDAPPRIAYLSYSTGEFDARTFRMARSAVDAGYAVTVYARWHPGLAPVEERDGYRLVRASWDWRFAIPGLRWLARRRVRAAMARTILTGPGRSKLAAATVEPAATPEPDEGAVEARRKRRLRPFERWHWWPRIREFPLRPMGWAVALDAVAEPADIWHGMWAGSLPALERLQRRHGGRTIYDSRDVFMRSREFTRLGQPGRAILEQLERRWAQRADRVLTVNDAYAGLLASQLRIERPAGVMNCPERWTPPTPRPDRIRGALGIEAGTAIVLYQGRLTFERGVEEAMEAILQVPDAALVLMGFGVLRDGLIAAAERPPYRGHLYLVPAVTPDELLEWTASADVLVMAIQPTTLNHRYTTPQKLFESFAAGVPVVASDLPGMAGIVRETGAGVLCDPTSPAAIAAAIEAIVGAPTAEREAMRSRALRAAHERYNWEAQVETLFTIYRDLLPPRTGATRVAGRLPRR
jgi:glycosyltransferase involved in cell wall biosynthesis